MTLTRDKAEADRSSHEMSKASSQHAAYRDDAYSWALQQAELLRSGQLDRIDVDNIADEIADVAKRELKATRGAIRLVIQHLLKWDHQPDRRSRIWALTVRTQRRMVQRQLDENPGIGPELPRLITEAFSDARDAALDETGLSEMAIPQTCPYSFDDILSRRIVWPEHP